MNDILGIFDRELEQRGFYDIEFLKNRVYGAMSQFLRGQPSQYVRKPLDKHGII